MNEENTLKGISGKGEVGEVDVDANTDGIKARRTRAKPKIEHIEQDSIDRYKTTKKKKLRNRV